MTYCTNCGKENSKKICPHCGVKRNKTHKFCEWCGSEIDEKASICTNCGEKVKEGFGKKVMAICGGLYIAMMVLFIWNFIYGNYNYVPWISVFMLLVAIALLLPFVKKLIREKTIRKKGVRLAVNVARVILAFVLSCTAMTVAPDATFEVIADYATDAGEVMLHEEVRLKNENSYILNDSSVTYDLEPYNGKENLRCVHVILDYSAENGFGGMGRDTYSVDILFDVTTGYYYSMNGKRIK